jgi:hypothetical protein
MPNNDISRHSEADAASACGLIHVAIQPNERIPDAFTI